MPNVVVSDTVLPSYALRLRPQKDQRAQMHLTPAFLFNLLGAGPAWSVWIDDRLVALGGHTPVWAGRTILWGFLSQEAGPAMPVMTKAVMRRLETLASEFPRIEAYADVNHDMAGRWLRLLGFDCVAKLAHFYGRDTYALYERVRS